MYAKVLEEENGPSLPTKCNYYGNAYSACMDKSALFSFDLGQRMRIR